MIPKVDSNSIEQTILKALQKGDKNRGQLFDITGKNYPVLVRALQSLQSKALIEIYFMPQDSLSILTYRLRSEP